MNGNQLATTIAPDNINQVCPMNFGLASAVIRLSKSISAGETIQMMNQVNSIYYAKYIDMIHRLHSAGKID